MGRAREFIIHIGPGKTGTSSIQKFCYENRAQLAKLGLIYPEIGLHYTAHYVLSQKWGGWLKPEEMSADPDAEWQRLADLARQCPGRLLISSENFEAIARDRDWRSHLEFIRDTVPAEKTTIIGYHRGYFEMFESSYKEFVKNGKFCGSMEDWIERTEKAIEIGESPSVNIWQRFGDVFGKENVIIKLYDAKPSAYKTHVSSFLSSLDIPLSGGQWIETIDENPSLSAASTHILTNPGLARLRGSDAFHQAVRAVFDKKTYKRPGQKTLLGTELKTRLQAMRLRARPTPPPKCNFFDELDDYKIDFDLKELCRQEFSDLTVGKTGESDHFDPALEQFSLNEILDFLARIVSALLAERDAAVTSLKENLAARDSAATSLRAALASQATGTTTLEAVRDDAIAERDVALAALDAALAELERARSFPITKSASLLERLDYELHLAASRLPLTSSAFKSRFSAAAARRWRNRYRKPRS